MRPTLYLTFIALSCHNHKNSRSVSVLLVLRSSLPILPALEQQVLSTQDSCFPSCGRKTTQFTESYQHHNILLSRRAKFRSLPLKVDLRAAEEAGCNYLDLIHSCRHIRFLSIVYPTKLSASLFITFHYLFNYSLIRK
jgi:hypothetical protein